MNFLRYNDSITVSSAKERSKHQSAIIAEYTAKLELSHSTLTQEYHEAKADEKRSRERSTKISFSPRAVRDAEREYRWAGDGKILSRSQSNAAL